MDALLMCGGRGTRLDADAEKPLYEIGGRAMVDRVRDALAASRIETTYAVVSPKAPRTRSRLDDPVIETPGDGYVADLRYALERVDSPVLTVATDLPLLAGDAVDAVLDRHAGGSLAVCVPVALKRAVGASVDATMESDGRVVAPAGVNVVSRRGDETAFVTHDVRFAVNVNYRSDARIAEKLL